MFKSRKRITSLVVAVMYALCLLVAAPVQAYAYTPDTHAVAKYTKAQKTAQTAKALKALAKLPKSTTSAKAYDNAYEYTLLVSRYNDAANQVLRAKNMGVSYKGLKNYARLAIAKARINVLRAVIKTITSVIALINALPDVITIADTAKVNAANAAFNALTAAQQKLVPNKGLLTAAVTALAALNNPDVAVAAVVAQIAALPVSVTLANETAVIAARAAYTALTAASKLLVTNITVLTVAEAKIAELKAELNAAAAVVAQIAALPVPVTLANETAVIAARTAYTALTAAGKLLVTNLTVLTAAEAKIAELKSVPVVVLVSGITVTGTGDATTITTDIGTLQMLAAVLPANATNKTVTWSVTNGTGTATISSTGLLTAVSDGTVTVKATSVSTGIVNGTAVITLSNQKTALVINEAQLLAALDNTNITTISLGADIELTDPLTISRTVTIDGLENSIFGDTITISAGTVTLKNVRLTDTENLQTGDGNYGIMVQGGSLVADNIHMTVATDNADNDVGFNVASGANLDLRNSTITITDADGDQQLYAVYAQSGAGVVALTNNAFSFNARNLPGAYSYLIGMEGDLVTYYPDVTLTGTNVNDAYMKLLLVGADTLANKEGYAEDIVAVGKNLGIIGTDQGIYRRTPTGWTVITEDQLLAALAGSDTTISLGTDIVLTAPLDINRDVTIDGLDKSISGDTITISAGTVTLKNVTLTETENLQTDDGNYGIMVQGGSLVANNIIMTVATENADNNVGFNVASGASLDLRNSEIIITDAGGDQQQYAVYAQSGAVAVTLTNNDFSFNAINSSGAYSYLIGMEGDLVTDYPSVTLNSPNTNDAYMKLLLVGADTLANKKVYAEDIVAVGENLGIIGTDQGIYNRSASSWVKIL